MRFYEMRYENAKGMAWAGGYGPVRDLWFIKPTFLPQFRAFWKVNPREPGLYIDSGGRSWPDILGCGNAPPSEFLSERVVNSLSSIGARMNRIAEMPIAVINAKALKNVLPPRYFVIETIPGIEVDFSASNIPIDVLGKPILNPLPQTWPPMIKVRADSWNGTDIFDYSNFGECPHLNLLCTERVKELAGCEGWTNVRFKPLPAV